MLRVTKYVTGGAVVGVIIGGIVCAVGVWTDQPFATHITPGIALCYAGIGAWCGLLTEGDK